MVTIEVGGILMQEQSHDIKSERGLRDYLRAHPRTLPVAGCACLLIVALVGGIVAASSGGATSVVTDDQSAFDQRGSGEARDHESTSGEVESRSSGARADSGSTAGAAQPASVVVDVDGAVVAPGVFTLKSGARVSDAIAAAGGALPEADLTQLNRAAKIADGSKIHVPAAGENVPGVPAIGAVGASSASASSPDAGSPQPGLVNINTATEEELDALPGVGPSTAQAIIKEREANGSFDAPEDLMRVSGIGEKKFEKLKDSIIV